MNRWIRAIFNRVFMAAIILIVCSILSANNNTYLTKIPYQVLLFAVTFVVSCIGIGCAIINVRKLLTSS